MGDDVVGNFMVITGASEDIALQYLSSADFNLEQSVAMYFAASGDHHEQPPPAQQPPPSYTSGQQPSRQFSGRLVDYEDDDVEQSILDSVLEQSGLPVTRSHQHVASAAPVLVHSSGHLDLFGGNGGNAGQPFPQRTESSPSSRMRTTEELFNPPAYAFNGDFAKCCENAARNNRWVILNILRAKNFLSGCLNRDVWRDELVSHVVPEMCVLFQVVDDTQDGRLIEERYHLRGMPGVKRDAPVIAIIDPVTKAIVRHIPIRVDSSGAVSASSFLEDITSFIEQNPPEFHSVVSTSAAPQYPPTFDVDDGMDMDEDEMLRLAIEESKRTATKRESQERRLDEQALSPPPSKQQPRVTRGDDEAIAVAPPGPLPHECPPPQPQAVVPVDISAFTAPEPGDVLFKLRIRMPMGPMELPVSGSVPVRLLVDYLAFRIQESNPATYAARPVIEIRSGFPPKPCEIPADPSMTLKDWGAVKPSDSILVHIV